MKGFPDVRFNWYGSNIPSASQQQQPKHLLLPQRENSENRRLSIIETPNRKMEILTFYT